MSISALITGRLIFDPDRRTGDGGKTFTVAKVSTSTDNGDALCSVIAFGSVGDKLAELTKGDTVALSGTAKISSWSAGDGQTRTGLSINAHQILTAYQLRRKRQAMDMPSRSDEASIPAQSETRSER